MDVEPYVLILVAFTILLVGILGVLANWWHARTRAKLDEIHSDMRGEFHAAQTRSDRENEERAWSIQGVRSALETLRLHIISLFRDKP